MAHKIKKQIMEIIGQSYPIDGAERQRLEKVFSHLADYQDEFLSALEKRLDAELEPHEWDNDFDVSVKLVKCGQTSGVRNFLPINVGCSIVLTDENGDPFADNRIKFDIRHPFFLNADYDEAKTLCNKNYVGVVSRADGSIQRFSYRLQRHYRFIRHERDLFEIASNYHIKRPVIFSPFARKAVDVFITGLRAEDLKGCTALDFKNERLILGHELMWNVKVQSDTYNREPTTGVDGKLVRYNYFHEFDSDAKAFVLHSRHCDDIHRRVDANTKTIIIAFNALLNDREYKRVILNDVEVESDAFNNDFPKRNNRLRLRTKGDVENVLSCFNSTDVGKKFPASYFGSTVGKARAITLYSREDKYYIPVEERMLGAVRNKPDCVIGFGGDAASVIKTDYANYVIDYMSRNYPEFGWAGVNA